jgi:hypothetical protein
MDDTKGSGLAMLTAEEAERLLRAADPENHEQRLEEAQRKVRGRIFIEKVLAYNLARDMGRQTITDWLMDGVSHKAIMVRLGFPLRTPKPRIAKVTLAEAPAPLNAPAQGEATAAERVAIDVAMNGFATACEGPPSHERALEPA